MDFRELVQHIIFVAHLVKQRNLKNKFRVTRGDCPEKAHTLLLMFFLASLAMQMHLQMSVHAYACPPDVEVGVMTHGKVLKGMLESCVSHLITLPTTAGCAVVRIHSHERKQTGWLAS